MKIAIHAGHNPDGKVACGAVGFGKESTLAREVCAYLDGYLTFYLDAEVIDTTCDNGTSANDVLKKIIQKTNSVNPELSVSIHFNASTAHSAHGSEVWYYTGNISMANLGDEICKELEKYGYRRRGVKPTGKLAVLRKIECDSILVECAFVTSENDMNMFNSRQVAKRIAKGIAKYYNSKRRF